MSQEKVDRYKKEKQNRKQIVKKQKIQNVLRKCAVCVVAILLIAGIGYSAYGSYEANKAKEEVEVDYSSIMDFPQNLSEASGEAAQ